MAKKLAVAVTFGGGEERTSTVTFAVVATKKAVMVSVKGKVQRLWLCFFVCFLCHKRGKWPDTLLLLFASGQGVFRLRLIVHAPKVPFFLFALFVAAG